MSNALARDADDVGGGSVDDVDATGLGRRFVNRVSRGIFASRRWTFLLVVSAIAIIKTGVWVIPTIPLYAVMASDPFHYHPGLQYLPENWLHTFLGWLTFARGWHSFAVLNLLIAIAFLVVMFVLFFRRLSDRSARIATLIFLAMPVSTTAFYWLGLDSLTVLLLALALLFMRRWWLVLLVGVLLGFQAFEQGLVSAGLLLGANGLAALMKQRSWRSIISPAALVIGVIAGVGLQTLLFRLWGITIDYSRLDWFKAAFPELVKQYLQFPFLIWYSILAVTWIAVVRFAFQGRRAIPLLVALGVLAAVTLFDSDHTRAASIFSLLIVAEELLLDEKFLKSVTNPEIVFFAAMWVIVPFLWVWGVVVQPPMITFDIEFVLHKLFGWFDVPSGDQLTLWPFIIP